ncbi:hypothetical protein RvY_07458 [Ramazzottius varieornatus]|uniref:Uncharacterized protein n=1 Tax=Ramazzottius varieornatus TaxID=947166 RepID=A0A1D1V2H2_RAMVA|nr:hypothetical protein RvY_07458 [Ramazzottius varieornatus]
MSESSSRMAQFFEEQERLFRRRRTNYALRTENMLTETYYVRHTSELAEMADTIAGLLWTELLGQSVDRELIKGTTTADIVDCTSPSGKAL